MTTFRSTDDSDEAAHAWLEQPRGWPALRGLPHRPTQPSARPINQDWVADAACRDAPPHVGDAFLDARSQEDGAELAKQWCHDCPVKDDCVGLGRATWAWGVHGGIVLINGRVAPTTNEWLSGASAAHRSDEPSVA